MKIDDHKMRPGQSVWVATANERERIQSAFGGYKRLHKSPLVVKTRKVDASDPRGAGFRIWFLSEDALTL